VIKIVTHIWDVAEVLATALWSFLGLYFAASTFVSGVRSDHSTLDKTHLNAVPAARFVKSGGQGKSTVASRPQILLSQNAGLSRLQAKEQRDAN